MTDSKSKTSTIDLDEAITVNGVTYGPGKGVEVPAGQREDIVRIAQDAAAGTSAANIHHGAVPPPAYPNEATAQTPTRPLGAPNLRQPVNAQTGEPVGNAQVVDDLGVGHEVDSVEQAKADFEASQTVADPDAETTPGEAPVNTADQKDGK